MVVVWILGALVLVFIVLSYLSVARVAIPLEPALVPGDIGEARDPEFFALEEQIFLEHSYHKTGDFFWHQGLTSIAMRIFRGPRGEAYGWAIEEAMAGVDYARHSVSVLTGFADGTLLDTTSMGETSLIKPPWFLREAAVPDTELLLRRHAERRAGLLGQGKEIVPAPEDENLLVAIRHNERRLSEYQVETGRMRLDGDKLRYTPSGAILVLLRGLARTVSGPFRPRGIERR